MIKIQYSGRLWLVQVMSQIIARGVKCSQKCRECHRNVWGTHINYVRGRTRRMKNILEHSNYSAIFSVMNYEFDYKTFSRFQGTPLKVSFAPTRRPSTGLASCASVVQFQPRPLSPTAGLCARPPTCASGTRSVLHCALAGSGRVHAERDRGGQSGLVISFIYVLNPLYKTNDSFNSVKLSGVGFSSEQNI